MQSQPTLSLPPQDALFTSLHPLLWPHPTFVKNIWSLNFTDICQAPFVSVALYDGPRGSKMKQIWTLVFEELHILGWEIMWTYGTVFPGRRNDKHFRNPDGKTHSARGIRESFVELVASGWLGGSASYTDGHRGGVPRRGGTRNKAGRLGRAGYAGEGGVQSVIKGETRPGSGRLRPGGEWPRMPGKKIRLPCLHGIHWGVLRRDWQRWYKNNYVAAKREANFMERLWPGRPMGQ